MRTTPSRLPGNADRKRQFRETARDILHMSKVKRQMGEAVDTAGTFARAMEQAYRMGFEDALKGPADPKTEPPIAPVGAPSDAMNWTLIPPRTRNTFWSICLAALGRDGRTQTASYLEAEPTRRGTLAWQLVVPDRRQAYERSVGDGTIVTLVRLGLLHKANDETRVTLSEYGIRTWNRFCERGGHWPDDLVEKLP
jgi:hypothetical protein